MELERLYQELRVAQTGFSEAHVRIGPQIRELENELRSHRNKCSNIRDAIARLERAQARAQARAIVKGSRFSLFDLLQTGEGNTKNYQWYSKSGRELNVNIFPIEIDITGLPIFKDESASAWEANEKLDQSGLEWVSKNMPGLVFSKNSNELSIYEGGVTIRSTDVAKLKAAYMAGGSLAKIWAKFKKSGRNTTLAWENIFGIEK